MAIEHLVSHVNTLATDEGRVVGTHGHQDAKNYIVSQLSTTKLRPHTGNSFEIPYEMEGAVFTNIVGILEGRNKELPSILLGAHYDTIYDTPGADDNAAAVSILLEMARELRPHHLEHSVIFCIFDAEEPPNFLQPSMGSSRYYFDQRKSDIHCALIMDLVGHDVPINSFEDLLFITGMESQEELSRALLETCPPNQLRPIPILNSNIGDLSDHHVFRINEVPYLFMSCGIWSHYHRPTDTPERLNYEKIYGIKEYLRELINDIDKRDLTGKFEGYDSTPVEANFLNKNAGPLLPTGNVTNRPEIDAAVHAIALSFGL